MKYPSGREPRQLPLDLDHRSGYSRDDLILAGSNREAVAVVDEWPGWPSPVTILTGPTGSGKSHLATIWQARTGAARINPDAIGDALPDVSAEAAFLIDDIGSAGFDEKGLFHLMNAVNENGSFLLMTSRRLPGQWPVRLPDLASRLQAATIVRIAEPDDELLGGVMTKLFADRQIAVDPHVVTFVVHRIERSLETVVRVVEQLDRLALAQKSRITRSLAAEVVSEADQINVDENRTSKAGQPTTPR